MEGVVRWYEYVQIPELMAVILHNIPKAWNILGILNLGASAATLRRSGEVILSGEVRLGA